MTAISEEMFRVYEHEAGHAVMRRLRGLPATALSVAESGEGWCLGTGVPVDAEDKLFVVLAGYAVEFGYGFGGPPDFARSVTDDFTKAGGILEHHSYLRGFVSGKDGQFVLRDINDALTEHFLRVCNVLQEYASAIEELAYCLSETGRLSAEEVDDILGDESLLTEL